VQSEGVRFVFARQRGKSERLHQLGSDQTRRFTAGSSGLDGKDTPSWADDSAKPITGASARPRGGLAMERIILPKEPEGSPPHEVFDHFKAVDFADPSTSKARFLFAIIFVFFAWLLSVVVASGRFNGAGARQARPAR